MDTLSHYFAKHYFKSYLFYAAICLIEVDIFLFLTILFPLIEKTIVGYIHYVCATLAIVTNIINVWQLFLTVAFVLQLALLRRPNKIILITEITLITSLLIPKIKYFEPLKN